MNLLITNARIVNEGEIFDGSILIENGIITDIIRGSSEHETLNLKPETIIDAKGKTLLPGIIDTHVHFREPGLTHKGDLHSESKAALAGGVTGFFDMPNTIPNATTSEILEEKFKIASEKSLANYSFFAGATNDNLNELLKLDPKAVCGIKIFLGTSTGNMLVDHEETLTKIFSSLKLPIAAHCEDETIISNNLDDYKNKYGDNIPFDAHPLIRSEIACVKSTKEAIERAKELNARLQIMHVSTGKETQLFDNSLPVSEKRITSETCVNYLYFDDKDYNRFGSLIKCNPAIKKLSDRKHLLEALIDGRIDVISSDHAPHSAEEKQSRYLKAPSGIPSVQHNLVAMLELFHKGMINLEKIVESMCHNPALCYNIDRRGFIRKGYYADIVLLDMNSPWTVSKENILYKCGWSPYENYTFTSKVVQTFVNGNLIYDNGAFNESIKGKRIMFNR